MFSFTRTQYKARVNAGIHNRISMLTDADQTLNDAARDVIAEVDLRSARRRASLDSNLFNETFVYPCPEDTDAYSIIGFPPAEQARSDQEIFLVPVDEFERQRNSVSGIFAVDYFNEIKTLLLSVKVQDSNELVISNFDSLTADGGTWQALNGAENLAINTSRFIKGTGSLSYDIGSVSETVAGVVNSSLTAIDASAYFTANGSAFIWAYLSDATQITNFKVRLGQDVSNYYELTVTSDHAGNAFSNGFNLLRFDLATAQSVGSPTSTGVVYAAAFMTKNTGKIGQTGFLFDYFVLKTGRSYDVKYQSKYPWVSSAGSWKQESTDDLDLLVADADEFILFRLKGIQYAAQEVTDYDIAEVAAAQYDTELAKYKLRNPSEVKVMTTEYYNYGNRGDNGSNIIQ